MLRSSFRASAIVACVSREPSSSSASTLWWYGLKSNCSKSLIARIFRDTPSRASRKAVLATSSRGRQGCGRSAISVIWIG